MTRLPGLPPNTNTLARGDAASIVYCATPATSDKPGVMFLGGFRSDMTGAKAVAVERHCAGQGQACIRFDYQGHGGSTGSIEGGTIGLWLEDTLAVLDQLTSGPQILVGSSMGGWLALLAALQRPTRVAGIVALAAATDFTEVLFWQSLDADRREHLMRVGRLVVPSEYDAAGYVFTRQLIEDGRDHLLLDRPIGLSMPVRLLHGMRDTSVPWRHSVKLLDRLASNDVRLTLVKDGDHRLSRTTDLASIQHAILELSGSE